MYHNVNTAKQDKKKHNLI